LSVQKIVVLLMLLLPIQLMVKEGVVIVNVSL